MFGDVRSEDGWCHNPTPQTFMYTYKALLTNKMQLAGLSCGCNCTEINTQDDGFMPLITACDVDLDAQNDINETLLNKLQSQWPSELRSNVLFYMAGWSARQIN